MLETLDGEEDPQAGTAVLTGGDTSRVRLPPTVSDATFDPAMPFPSDALLGRSAERARLRQLVTAASERRSDIVVLRGEAGVGKTALLDALARDAARADLSVMRLDGVEAELGLGFAALHRLLMPLLPRRHRLPARQAAALSTAFGLDDDVGADQFLVGLATLTLLTDAAADRALVCIVDDAQWLDEESLAVLAFVGRRLHADGVGLAMGVRDPDPRKVDLPGLAEIRLNGLEKPDAAALLASVVAERIDSAVASRLITHTGGNPLALTELARELTAAQMAGHSVLPDHLPLSRGLEDQFLEQTRMLSIAAQQLMLIAAADASNDPMLVQDAASKLGVGVTSSIRRETRDFMSLSPRVVFRHPSIRSAVYTGASPEARRWAHAGLAASLTDEHDFARRAWHLAAASTAPDETIAAALERSASLAKSRGGHSAEATLLARAAELTPVSEARATRFVAGSEAALSAGDVPRAEHLVEESGFRRYSTDLVGRGLRLEGLIKIRQVQHPRAFETLLAASDTLAPVSPECARDCLFDALTCCLISRLVGTAADGSQTELIERVTALTPSEHPPQVRDQLLSGWAALFAGDRDRASNLLRPALELLCTGPIGDGERWCLVGCFTAFELWDDLRLHQWLGRVIDEARSAGALLALRTATMVRATTSTLFGQFLDAEMHHAEHDELTSAIGGEVGLYKLQAIELPAWRGDQQEIREICAGVIAAHDLDPTGPSLVHVAANTLIILDLAAGNYEEATSHALRTFEKDPPQFGPGVLANLVEAAIRSGDRECALRGLERLSDRALASGTPWALGLLARARALTAPDECAEPFYLESIQLLSTSLAVTDQARSELVFGEWLRRQKRRADSRSHLHVAHDMFSEMGAQGFAERAARELAATGQRPRRRRVDTSNDLTPQERQIATLAADHLTNREIAAQMFLSAKTVEYHLHNIFVKLQISSRRQLPDALRASA